MASNQVGPVTRAGTPRDQETFSYLLSTLLNQCSYSPELQREYFSFFTTYILPHLQYVSFHAFHRVANPFQSVP